MLESSTACSAGLLCRKRKPQPICLTAGYITEQTNKTNPKNIIAAFSKTSRHFLEEVCKKKKTGYHTPCVKNSRSISPRGPPPEPSRYFTQNQTVNSPKKSPHPTHPRRPPNKNRNVPRRTDAVSERAAWQQGWGHFSLYSQQLRYYS